MKRGRELLGSLLRHKMALPGLLILTVLYAMMLFAEPIAPYHYDNEVTANSFAPPSKIRLRDTEGRFHLPFVYKVNYAFNEIQERVYYEDTTARYSLRLFPKGDTYKLWGLIPMRRHLFGTGSPEGRFYLIGADAMGRDLFSRIVYGSRVSLSIGFVGVLFSTIIGLSLGGIAGYFGGWIDNVLMRFSEMVMLFPSFFLLLVLRYLFPLDMSSVEVYFVIILILSFIGWAGLGRVIRGMTKSIREREFVQAAEAIGQRRSVIIFRHILPQTYSYLVISLTLAIPGYILGESGLSLIGLGIVEPHASWGNLLTNAMSVAAISLHPWLLLPGLFIFLTVMSFNLVGDGLRDILDPRHS